MVIVISRFVKMLHSFAYYVTLVDLLQLTLHLLCHKCILSGYGTSSLIHCGAARQTIMCEKRWINILGVLGLLQEQNHLKIVAVIMTILVVVVVLITLVMFKRVVIAVAVIKVSYKIPSYISYRI
jgi:hypothetical protein